MQISLQRILRPAMMVGMADSSPPSRFACTRRQLLQTGSLGLLGLTLPQLLIAESEWAGKRPGKVAKSCILIFLEGGPSHIDLWDLKPDAPADVRGEFQPIQTKTPGVTVCEHLPLLAQQWHHFAQVRSVQHKIVDHNAGAYYMLTGRSPLKGSELITGDLPDNFPPFGATLAALRPIDTKLPPFVHLPDIMSNLGKDLPGERAGFLGASFDPLIAGDPSVANYQIPGLSLPPEMNAARLHERRALLAGLNQPQAAGNGGGRFEQFRAKAFELLCSSETKRAFDLSQESAATRERYGLPDREDRSIEARKFGGLPHLGQCLLLSRRLIEAGVRLVTVVSGRRIDQAWDTHRDHFPLLKKSLLPYTDRGVSALLVDLHERGLLDETLVVMMGEFGRTPRLGQITSSAGAAREGRDHWPHCYTVLLAGGPVQSGAIFGASDRIGAYPANDPVSPEDIAATIYAALGIAPETRIYDQLQRPHSVALGQPIGAIL